MSFARTAIALALGTALGLALPTWAQEAPTATLTRLDGSTIPVAEIERRLPDLMERVWLPGLSVVVLDDGEIAYRRAFGVRDVRSGAPITEATSFTGLSWSKTITAYLVMRLVDKGLFDLDRPLHTYLSKSVPDYEFYADLAGDPRYETITARHVLSHTTGWPNWRWFTDDGTLRFLFEPGSRHSYSGEGFAYLQLALEEHTGRSFAELAASEVFAPLGMNNSSMVWEEAFEADYAEDHDNFGRPLERERWDEAGAAGSLQTTIGDYATFVDAVMSSTGLEASSRDEMLAQQVDVRHARMFGPRLYEETSEHEATGLGWTLGWGRVETPFGPAVFHTGNDQGGANYAIAFPERNYAVLLMGNSNRVEGIASEVVELLSADTCSPFEFLGYDPWDSPRRSWIRTLATEGLTAGIEQWQALGDERQEGGLVDEEVFHRAGEAILHFRTAEEALEFQSWRRQVFPDSADALRALVGQLLEAGRGEAALEELRGSADLTSEIEWFASWARAIVRPTWVDTESLAGLAGVYEARRFELRGDRLYYGRDDARPNDYRELIPMGDDTFVMWDLDFFRLRFERDEAGLTVRVVGLYEGGHTDSNERSPE